MTKTLRRTFTGGVVDLSAKELPSDGHFLLDR